MPKPVPREKKSERACQNLTLGKNSDRACRNLSLGKIFPIKHSENEIGRNEMSKNTYKFAKPTDRDRKIFTIAFFFRSGMPNLSGGKKFRSGMPNLSRGEQIFRSGMPNQTRGEHIFRSDMPNPTRQENIVLSDVPNPRVRAKNIHRGWTPRTLSLIHI